MIPRSNSSVPARLSRSTPRRLSLSKPSDLSKVRRLSLSTPSNLSRAIASLAIALLLTACATQPADEYGFTTVHLEPGMSNNNPVTWTIDGTEVTRAERAEGATVNTSYPLADRDAFVLALDRALNKPDNAPPCDDAEEMTAQTDVRGQIHAVHLQRCDREQRLFDAMHAAIEDAG